MTQMVALLQVVDLQLQLLVAQFQHFLLLHTLAIPLMVGSHLQVVELGSQLVQRIIKALTSLCMPSGPRTTPSM